MKIILYSLILFNIFISNVFGQKIYLSNTIYSGYTYSTDSVNFRPFNLYEIKQIMKDDPEAMNLLNSYRRNLTISKVLGYPAGFIVGWAIGGYIGNGELNNTLLLIGGGLAVFAIISERMAYNIFKKAVSVYNDNNSGQLSINLEYINDNNSFNVLLRYSF